MKPRFFLHGIGGVYNYGCEAIVRGTAAILTHSFPDSQVIYLSRRPEMDARALRDCPVEVRNNTLPPLWHPGRIARAALRRIGIKRWAVPDNIMDVTKDDCLLSIGGDIFSLPEKPYPPRVDISYQTRVPLYCRRRGACTVLWGASVGPFEDWPESVPVFREFLRELDLITVRESATMEYLQQLEITHTLHPVADPAFLMPADVRPDDMPFPSNDGVIVGVNLSPLSVRHTYGWDSLETAIHADTEFVSWLVRECQAKVILIPHVVIPSIPRDDDLAYLLRIYETIDANDRTSVAILPGDLGARRTKGVVSRCDALVAARMHCAIAGVSSGVPTLFVSYSVKAKGMAQLVYGDDTWCVGLDAFGQDAGRNRIRELLYTRSQVKTHLTSVLPRLKEQAMVAGEVLREALQRNRDCGYRRTGRGEAV